MALVGKALIKVGPIPAKSALVPPSLHINFKCRPMETSQGEPGLAVCNRVLAASTGRTHAHITDPAMPPQTIEDPASDMIRIQFEVVLDAVAAAEDVVVLEEVSLPGSHRLKPS
eukprot:CAMPEP_0175065680 /NCGR_PEP_ID=MMETSP0052_2-20121109/16072_1 /TAXON_ID=51329 ORGANISM="Polytomella parva, Strain SAG 63-3" /NCGR_SAMPLE_ID=MMETSP0052_2 /ASSEMBLY_ACC=CAM_ASM_000194 /LENGTH=113 /DNA_ID=CAMNT_0016332267 /DNA_START=1435 /DNA_END=1776 /DNA_ORIENTATION=+